MITAQGDYLILGAFASKESLGAYFFAFNLSMLTVRIVGGNVGTVLYPALVTLQVENTGTQGVFRKVVTITAWAAALLTSAQVALAPPIFHLLYAHRWEGAIPLFQILSVGAGAYAVSILGGPMIMSDGRFGTFLRLACASTLAFIILVVIGASVSGAIGTAVAVAFHLCVFSVVGLILALNQRGAWRSLMQILVRPMGAALVASVAGILAVKATSHQGAPEILQVGATAVTLLATFLVTMWCVEPDVFGIYRRLLWQPPRKSIGDLNCAVTPVQ